MPLMDKPIYQIYHNFTSFCNYHIYLKDYLEILNLLYYEIDQYSRSYHVSMNIFYSLDV